MAEQAYDCRDDRWDQDQLTLRHWFVPSDINPHWQWWNTQKIWRLTPIYVFYINF
jgi:hypothetical protein